MCDIGATNVKESLILELCPCQGSIVKFRVEAGPAPCRRPGAAANRVVRVVRHAAGGDAQQVALVLEVPQNWKQAPTFFGCCPRGVPRGVPQTRTAQRLQRQLQTADPGSQGVQVPEVHGLLCHEGLVAAPPRHPVLSRVQTGEPVVAMKRSRKWKPPL